MPTTTRQQHVVFFFDAWLTSDMKKSPKNLNLHIKWDEKTRRALVKKTKHLGISQAEGVRRALAVWIAQQELFANEGAPQ